ncbi:hypothetical protein DXG03_007692 [Asterophora parasitica]|uniref:Uncharacterized protein n=1 Tax=Asterophora parasitica TaxID=117018 RepID=A0A9P7G6K2_9AGAR|nr:hypothetical protein DXG03_007692 [Asterophora parasitica]
MPNLYALERAEALRRAEFEERHAEALRRAEFQARISRPSVDPQGWARISKSATTSPVMNVHRTLAGEGYFGVSNARGGFDDDVRDNRDRDRDRDREREAKARRRLSGPSFSMAPVSPTSLSASAGLVTSRSSGHLVDTMSRPHTHAHHAPSWSHPYNSTTRRRRASGGLNSGLPPPQHRHDESPSPISSDSESPPLHMKTRSAPGTSSHRHAPYGPHAAEYHHPHPHHQSQSPPLFGSGSARSDFTWTPSTSPFLGPLRTLNIHSTNPSRAPSPVLLPPPHMALIEEDPGVKVHPSQHHHHHHHHYAHGNNMTSGGIPLTSPHWTKQQQQQRAGAFQPQYSTSPGGSGASSPGVLFARSASSSRAPSPPLWPAPRPASGHQQQHHHRDSDAHSYSHSHSHSHPPPAHPHHHHLAHSVRAAFGMTPINTSSPRSSSTHAPPHTHAHAHAPHNSILHQPHPMSTPHSGVSTPMHLAHHLPVSMPGSRSGSPPIVLPPLKGLGEREREKGNGLGLDSASSSSSATAASFSSTSKVGARQSNGEDSSANGNGKEAGDAPGAGKGEERETLPGFSEFAAASMAQARY